MKRTGATRIPTVAARSESSKGREQIKSDSRSPKIDRAHAVRWSSLAVKELRRLRREGATESVLLGVPQTATHSFAPGEMQVRYSRRSLSSRSLWPGKRTFGGSASMT